MGRKCAQISLFPGKSCTRSNNPHEIEQYTHKNYENEDEN